MNVSSTYEHREHETSKGFDEVVAAFEATVAAPDDEAYTAAVMAIPGEYGFESKMRSAIGSSGFIRFLDLDHGAWLSVMGVRKKAKAYVFGNPLVALTMLRHDVGAGLNLPIRAMIYETEPGGATRFSYDLPSSLMARLDNTEVAAASRILDLQLLALAEEVTGEAG